MTRCKEAYDKRREVKKIKGQVCSTERDERTLERMDAYTEFIGTCADEARDALYCNFPDRAYHSFRNYSPHYWNLLKVTIEVMSREFKSCRTGAT